MNKNQTNERTANGKPKIKTANTSQTNPKALTLNPRQDYGQELCRKKARTNTTEGATSLGCRYPETPISLN